MYYESNENTNDHLYCTVMESNKWLYDFNSKEEIIASDVFQEALSKSLKHKDTQIKELQEEILKMAEDMQGLQEGLITICLVEYEKLLKDSDWLAALEAAGVDNWEGFEHAQEIYAEWNKELEE